MTEIQLKYFRELTKELEEENKQLKEDNEILMEEINGIREGRKVWRDAFIQQKADIEKMLEELTNKSTFNGAMESVVKVNDILNLIKELEGK